MQNPSTPSKRRAFGYCRVSTTQQAAEGDSLEAQRRAIELVCELEGFELVEVFTDPAISGGVPFDKRPEGARLLAAVQSGDVIVAVKLDRCFRDAHDALGTLKAVQQKGVGLFLKDMGGDVTSSSVSAMVFGMLASVGQFERARIRERVSDVKRAQKAMGRYLGGGAPLGYTVDTDAVGKQIVVPDLAVHEEARKLKAQGYSARLAAGHLIAMGHKATHTSVLNLWKQIGA